MKRLSDADLEKMLDAEFAPDDSCVKKQVRTELKLSRLVPPPGPPAPKCARLDFHQKTEDQAWRELNKLLQSGARSAKIITGASGILKTKFQDWVINSTIAPRIISCHMLNNGCFEIKIRKSY